MHRLLSLTPSCKQKEHREHSSDMCTCKLSAHTHPDQVHFLAVLHEVPNFGSHLLPHPTKVPQHTELLEGLINLQHTQTHSVLFYGVLFMILTGVLEMSCTSWIILCVAGVSGVYRILPMSRGFRALQIILEMGLDSRLRIMLLQ